MRNARQLGLGIRGWLRGKKVNGVRWKARRVPADVTHERGDQAAEAIGGNVSGYDEHAAMRLLVGEEIERDADEVISVAGDDAATFRGAAPKLFRIADSNRAPLVRAHGIDPSLAQHGRDTGAQVFFEIQPHWRRRVVRGRLAAATAG